MNWHQEVLFLNFACVPWSVYTHIIQTQIPYTSSTHHPHMYDADTIHTSYTYHVQTLYIWTHTHIYHAHTHIYTHYIDTYIIQTTLYIHTHIYALISVYIHHIYILIHTHQYTMHTQKHNTHHADTHQITLRHIYHAYTDRQTDR